MATQSKARWKVSHSLVHLLPSQCLLYVPQGENRGPTCGLQECALLGLVGTFLLS